MGFLVIRKVSELGREIVLAPERFDPRRTIKVGGTRCLEDLVDVVTESVNPKILDDGRPALVLDTTHAYEGFVLTRNVPMACSQVGSAKRRLKPGDVIISRLRPYLRQVAVVDRSLFEITPGGNHVLASTEFFVLRSRKSVEPAALVPFLLCTRVQTALAAGQEGGHHPRFTKDLLKSIEVPDQIVSGAGPVASEITELAARVLAALSRSADLARLADTHAHASTTSQP